MPADTATLPVETAVPPAGRSCHRAVAVGIVFASFFMYSALRSPVPGTNEPHYLCKAKHFWDASYCAGDFFLDSSNPHFVFYATAGWLTRFLTLEQTAWICRGIGLLLLAAGFCELFGTLTRGRWTVVWVAWLFLGLQATGSYSGEWVVGGTEGKVFAYAFAFWGTAHGLRGARNRAAVLLGLAISFHPVIGMWWLLGSLFAVAVPLLPAGFRNWPWRSMALPAMLLFVCALPGLIPALATMGGAAPEVIRQANEIQVFDRIKHHLDPMRFPRSSHLGYGALAAIWLLLWRRAGLTKHAGFFHRLLLASMVFALAGLVLGVTWRNPALMKFYPFRLFDVLAPLATATAVAGWAYRRCEGAARCNMAWGLFAAVMLYAALLPTKDSNPSRLPPDKLADWKACCAWIRESTPADARCLTPWGTWGFKWYAQRAEFVSAKDCPQDARGIMEWDRRRGIRGRWENSRETGMSAIEHVRRFPKPEFVDYAILLRKEKGPVAEAVYEGPFFVVLPIASQSK